MPVGRRSRRNVRGDRGQAIIETVLVTWFFVLLLVIVLQVFLIDQHAYRLATSAHARLMDEAYRSNKPAVKYETRRTQKLQGPDEYVPVVGFFTRYGLTRDDLRIRSTHARPGGQKQIKLGRGTKADVPAGVEGQVDYSSLWSEVITGMSQVTAAKAAAQSWSAGRR